MPGAAIVTTDSMHRLPSSLVQRFAKAGMGGEKLASLLDVVTPLKNLPTIIFCHSASSCRAVLHCLRESGLDASGYFGDEHAKVRAAGMASFIAGGAGGAAAGETAEETAEESAGARAPPAAGAARASSRILVCTDIASRGIDLDFVEHVVNFDFPKTAAQYVHRAGRTARVGRTGTVTSIVHGKEKILAARIRDAVDSGEDILMAMSRPLVPPVRVAKQK